MKTKTMINGMKLLALFAIVTALVGVTSFATTSGPTPIPPAPSFQISTTATVLCRGVTNNVPITITNLGNSYKPVMESVQVSMSGSGLYDVGPSIDVSNIVKNLTLSIPVFVSVGAPEALTVVQVPITYNYLTYYSDSETRTLTFEVESCPTQLVMNVSPSVFVTGLVNNVTFSFTNTGSTALQNISTTLQASSKDMAEEIQFLGVQPIRIPLLPPGNTISIDQTLYENVSRTFTINMTATLFNGTNPEEILEGFTVFSEGTINMVPSSITVSPSNVTAGSIFSTSFVVTDTGTVGASGATATALVPKGFRAYGSNSEYLGDIQTDTQTPISLTLIANSTVKSGDYVIPIVLAYQNNLKDNLNTTIDVPVTVIGSGGTVTSGGRTFTSNSLPNGTYARRGGGGSVLIEAVLVIAVLALAYLYLKERKKTHGKK